MILWHVGTTLVILWFVFRGNPRLDYRYAIAGSLLPDVLDKPVGRVFFRDQFDTGHLWGHTLLVNVVFFAVLFFLRGRRKRKLVLVPIASLLHLAEDGMWNQARVFWWPLFGTAFPREPIAGPWWEFLDPVRQPWTVAGEAVGAILLLWLFAAHGILNREGLLAFLRTGHLETTA